MRGAVPGKYQETAYSRLHTCCCLLSGQHVMVSREGDVLGHD